MSSELWACASQQHSPMSCDKAILKLRESSQVFLWYDTCRGKKIENNGEHVPYRHVFNVNF